MAGTALGDCLAMLFAEIDDVRAGGLEDPQAEQPEHRHQREIAPVGGLAGRGEQCPELRVGKP